MNVGFGSSAGLYDHEIDPSGYKDSPTMEKPQPMSESDKDGGVLKDLNKFFPEENNNKVVTIC